MLFSWAQLEPGNLSCSAGLFCYVLAIGQFTQPSNHTPRRPFCLGDCRDPSILQCSCPFQLLHTRKAPAVPALGYQVPASTLVVESVTHPTPCWGSTCTYQCPEDPSCFSQVSSSGPCLSCTEKKGRQGWGASQVSDGW